MTTYIRFLLSSWDDVHRVVDGEPGPGEVARSHAEEWQASGIPMEVFEKSEPEANSGTDDDPTPAKKKGKR